MTIAGSFALLSVIAATGPGPVLDGAKASLGVTATVIRPAEISAVTSGSSATVVRIQNPTNSEVLTTAGIIRQADADLLVAIPNSAGSVYITLTY